MNITDVYATIVLRKKMNQMSSFGKILRTLLERMLEIFYLEVEAPVSRDG